MDTRPIGSLTVSAVGLGCNNFGWHLDEAASRAVVHAALDAGVTHFDTADVYGEGQSEAFLGRALGARRADVVVATKFGSRIDDARQGAHPDYVARAAEDSLRRLGTDVIDLYYLHKPDPSVPIADTLGALDQLVEAGKVREVACSNLSADQLREADGAARGARFAALQSEYSLLHRAPETDGTLDACGDLGLAFVPYFPLKSGLLSGKYRKGRRAPAGARLSGDTPGSRFAPMGDHLLTDANLDAVERLAVWAEAHGGTVLDLAFAYLLARPAVASVIAGATRPEQVAANVAAAGLALSEGDLESLDDLLAQPA
jgi:aryl-alcohol dehydrogenase-like predicted oxidoreductase